MTTVYFYSFLLGVWRYICAETKEENGQETYIYISDFVSDSRSRSLKKKRIGFRKYADIQVSYETEIPEAEIRVTGLRVAYLKGAGDSDGNGKEKSVSQIFEEGVDIMDNKDVCSRIIGG